MASNIADPIPPPGDATISLGRSLGMTLRRRPLIPPILLPQPAQPLPRLLAPRSIFFTIPLRAPADESNCVAPVNLITGSYLAAIDRVNNAPERDGNRPGLDRDQRSALVALLTVLNDYYPTHSLTTAVTGIIASTTDVIELANYGNTIHRGLAAFESKNTPISTFHPGSSTLVESGASRRSPYSAPATSHGRRGSSRPRLPRGSEQRNHNSTTPHSEGSTSHNGDSSLVSESSLDVDATITEFPFSRRGSTPALPDPDTPATSSRNSRSNTVRASCKTRDPDHCRICDIGEAVSAHIIPFSIRDGKAIDFWKLVAMFRGEAETQRMKEYALEPDANNADNILNVVCLCWNCHHLFDHAGLALVPDIDATEITFPYSPWTQRAYDVTVEFPGGCSRDIRVVGETADGDLYRIKPGHQLHWSTEDPEEYPLPHPLLLQLHVVCSRMVKLRAAAGWRGDGEESDGGDTVWEDVQVDLDLEDEGKGVMTTMVVEEARDHSASVVERELGQRELERQMMWAKKHGGAEMVGGDCGLVGTGFAGASYPVICTRFSKRISVDE